MPVPFIPLQVGIQAIAWIHINSAGAGLRPPSVPAYHVKKFWLWNCVWHHSDHRHTYEMGRLLVTKTLKGFSMYLWMKNLAFQRYRSIYMPNQYKSLSWLKNNPTKYTVCKTLLNQVCKIFCTKYISRAYNKNALNIEICFDLTCEHFEIITSTSLSRTSKRLICKGNWFCSLTGILPNRSINAVPSMKPHGAQQTPHHFITGPSSSRAFKRWFTYYRIKNKIHF